MKRYADNAREYQRNYKLIAKYDLTVDEYQTIFELQSGKCAICKQASNKVLVVDHDHETGKVRALLCGTCNSGLGMFKDSPELLDQAARYLWLHKEDV